MKKIVLVGPPGVGKTTISRRCREEGLTTADLDDVIEQRTGKRPGELIREGGEERFREEEHRALEEILKTDFDVLAVGGGTFCFERNRTAIHRSGISVYLQGEEDELATRIYSEELQSRNTGNGIKRPVLYRQTSENQAQAEQAQLVPDLEKTKLYLKNLIAERRPHYEMAQLTVRCAGKTEHEIVREILTLVARRNGECL